MTEAPKKVDKKDAPTKLSLEQAIKNGDAVLKSSVDAMIAEEMEKKISKLKADLRAEIQKEDSIAKIAGSKMGAQSFLTASGLGDIDFAQRLMTLNISPKMATHLRDEHMRLTDAQLWEHVRNQLHKASLTAQVKTHSTIGL